MDSEFIAHMEDLLELYEEPYDACYPVICFDEKSKQLVAETRTPVPATSQHPRRYDYEYKRNGTRNLFIFVEPLRGWRHLEVTQRGSNEVVGGPRISPSQKDSSGPR